MSIAAALGFAIVRSPQSGCCRSCLADLPDHWFSNVFRYCPHTGAVSQWDVDAGEWVIMLRVGRWRARLMLALVLRGIGAEASKHELSTVELDKVLTRNL